MNNCSVVILEPSATAKPGDSTQRVHREKRGDELRGYLMASRTRAAMTAVGFATVDTYSLLVVTTQPVGNGWRVAVLADGEWEWVEYTVMGTQPVATLARNCKSLLLEAVA